VQGAGCRVHSAGCRMRGAGVQCAGGAGCRGCRGQGVQGAGCRVQGAGCRVQGVGCRVQGAGSGVHGRRAMCTAQRAQISYPPRSTCGSRSIRASGLQLRRRHTHRGTYASIKEQRNGKRQLRCFKRVFHNQHEPRSARGPPHGVDPEGVIQLAHMAGQSLVLMSLTR
jgi:hypothetical protein